MNTPPALTPDNLVEHIERDIHTCQELLQLLGVERQALEERNLTLLEDVIDRKTKALEQLEHQANLRAQWVATAPAKGKISLEDRWLIMIRSLAPPAENRWIELKELLSECHAGNTVNGKVLARKQATYSQLLKIVRGQSETGALYSAKGAARRGQSGTPLGEA